MIYLAKDYDLGMAALRAAAEANPNDLMIVGAAGVGHLHCGDLDDALAHFHRANRLSPGDLGAYFSLCGVAHVQLILGDYAEALVWATRAFTLNPNYDPTLWMLIAANAHLDRMTEAHRFLDDLRKIAPDSTVARIKAGQPAKDPGRVSTILEGLRLAGLDEA